MLKETNFLARDLTVCLVRSARSPDLRSVRVQATKHPVKCRAEENGHISRRAVSTKARGTHPSRIRTFDIWSREGKFLSFLDSEVS